ncbi:MAG: phycobilisome rod-core linker polypeptide [Cyanobacteria bacterium P01_D01_bin.73]
MTATFTNPSLGNASSLGLAAFEDRSPARRVLDSETSGDFDVLVRSVYRQVLGNAYVMESERLTDIESGFRDGRLDVREFVRSLAKSELYRSRFLNGRPSYQAVELNFKHLLGRAPNSSDEVRSHLAILNEFGHGAEVDSYLDSDEYAAVFGANIVPYYRGYKTQVGQGVNGFTQFLHLLRGAPSSDKGNVLSSKKSLTRSLWSDKPGELVGLSLAPKGKTIPVMPVLPTQVSDSARLIAQALGRPNYAALAKAEAARRSKEATELRFKPEIRRASAAVELFQGASEDEIASVIRAAYRQVFGNAHIMESDRVGVAESQLRLGMSSVREFVRSLAKSELYRSRFLDGCSRYRSIELNFKHLLGRAPENFEEMKLHSRILDQEGYEADIDWFIDSDEYQAVFGENTVPYYQGYGTRAGQRMMGFTNMLELLPSLSSSDRDLTGDNQPRVAKPILYDTPAGQVKPVDTRSLIREALKAPRPAAPKKVEVTAPKPAQYRDLEDQIAEKDALIEKLRRQLSEVSPFAAIGVSAVGSFAIAGGENRPTYSGALDALGVSFENSGSTPNRSRLQELTSTLEEKSAEAERLQERLQDAQRLAVVGFAKTNRWRRNTFSR